MGYVAFNMDKSSFMMLPLMTALSKVILTTEFEIAALGIRFEDQPEIRMSIIGTTINHNNIKNYDEIKELIVNYSEFNKMWSPF